MEISCLVVDDEQPAIDELIYILSQIKGIHVIGTAQNAKEAISEIHLKEPDLVFLDIKMSGHDGFEVIKSCSTFRREPYYVFVTAFDQYAVKAFKASAVDYILKPFQSGRIRESVEKIRQLLTTKRQGVLCDQLEKLVRGFESLSDSIIKISVKKKGRLLLLDPDEIVLFKAKEREIWVYQGGQRLKLHGITSLDQLERKLKGNNFFRAHRGVLVNLTHVKEVAPWFSGKYLLTINDQELTEVLVSRRRVKEMKTRLGL